MKTCVRCDSDDLSATSIYCRSCKKAIDSDSYQKNRDQRREKRRNDRREYVQWLKTLKMGQSCVDCENEYPWWVLQWDHLPGFEKGFDLAESNVRSQKTVLAEIDKCELVCANCHATRTYTRRVGVVGDTPLS